MDYPDLVDLRVILRARSHVCARQSCARYLNGVAQHTVAYGVLRPGYNPSLTHEQHYATLKLLVELKEKYL